MGDIARHAQRLRAAAFAQSCAQHGAAGAPLFARVAFSAGDPERVAHLLVAAQARVAQSAGDADARGIEFARLFLDATSQLTMRLDVEWPLSDLITQECREQLQRVFTNCMHLLHAEAVLADAWRLLCHAERVARRHARAPGAAGGRAKAPRADARVQRGLGMLRPLLLLRRRMGYFLSNLKFYVMTDVLHTQFARLERDITDGRGYDAARDCLRLGLCRMARDAFLDQGSAAENSIARQAIGGVVQCCVRLWGIVTTALSQLSGPTDFARSMLLLNDGHDAAALIANRFDAQAASLFKMLHTNAQVQKYRQLLARLDFNGYFSRNLAAAGHASAP